MPDKKFYLRLEDNEENGGVDVLACKEDGTVLKNGKVCQLTNDGKLGLYPNVNPEAGIALDENGYPKVS